MNARITNDQVYQAFPNIFFNEVIHLPPSPLKRTVVKIQKKKIFKT